MGNVTSSSAPAALAISSTISSAVSSVPALLPMRPWKTETFSCMMTDVAVSFEGVSSATIQLICAVWYLLEALFYLSSHALMNLWHVMEPTMSLLIDLETSTRWSIISCLLFSIVAVILHRRGTIESVGKLSKQIISIIPVFSTLIFLDVLPRFYLSTPVYRCVHFFLVFAVPVVSSALTVGENYLMSQLRPEYIEREELTNRGRSKSNSSVITTTTQHSSNEGEENRSNVEIASPQWKFNKMPVSTILSQWVIAGLRSQTYPRKERFNSNWETSVQPVQLEALKQHLRQETSSHVICDLNTDKRKLINSNGSPYTNCTTKATHVSASVLSLWLEYWIIVNVLRLFMSVMTSMVGTVISDYESSVSPLDSFALIKPLTSYSSINAALEGLNIVVHTIGELFNVLFIISVWQGDICFLYPIKDFLRETIDTLVNVFTGLNIFSPYDPSTYISHSWITSFLHSCQSKIVSNIPTSLLWASHIMFTLPHVIFLFFPAGLLRPVSAVVSIIIPVISGIRQTESYRQTNSTSASNVNFTISNYNSMYRPVAYFILLAVSDFVWSVIRFLTHDFLPCATHLHYIWTLSIQYFATRSAHLGFSSTNNTCTADSFAPRCFHKSYVSLPSATKGKDSIIPAKWYGSIAAGTDCSTSNDSTPQSQISEPYNPNTKPIDYNFPGMGFLNLFRHKQAECQSPLATSPWRYQQLNTNVAEMQRKSDDLSTDRIHVSYNKTATSANVPVGPVDDPEVYTKAPVVCAAEVAESQKPSFFAASPNVSEMRHLEFDGLKSGT